MAAAGALANRRTEVLYLHHTPIDIEVIRPVYIRVSAILRLAWLIGRQLAP